ncbi:DsbA family protein [Sulfurimonas sp.]|uniref:DsbA family protein n=1 Tax=Sulfurimonas sp. TaxID=2022749 RepID=UPI0025D1E0AE|nr:DsbA family protein [Sulfurimonas sp.]
MNTLYYILDPMCSWCYAFAPSWKKLLQNLPSHVEIEYIHGGLARHSDVPMPQEMQDMLQNTWKEIEQKVGTKFNYDFWSKCKPRRSTYLACQACVSARAQNKEYEMIQEIQKAYYQDALNPSDRDTLELAASNINLDVEKFSHDLESKEIVNLFEEDLNKRRNLGIRSFPSLVLKSNNEYFSITIDFTNYETILKQINSYL